MKEMNVKYPKGVEHVHGNIFRVRLSMIQVADGGLDVNSKKIEFKNPRWRVTADGKPSGLGFSPEDMDSLRVAIQHDGLNHPLRCRWYPHQSLDGVQLVDGERRFRCISRLVKEKASCWDCVAQTHVPAPELYEWIECRIDQMSDELAITHAFLGNDTALDIGTGATIGVLHHLRNAGKSDEEIMAILHKSKDWLHKTEKFLSLDETTLQALCDDKINRRVAKALGAIPSLADRHKRLAYAIRAADERIATLEHNIQVAEQSQMLAEAEKQVADELGGDVETQNKILERARKKVERAKLAVRRPRATIGSHKDYTRASKAVAASADEAKPVSIAKLEKFIYSPLCDILKSKGLHNGEQMDLDMDDARLLKNFCEILRTGIIGDPETIVGRILSSHRAAKKKQQLEAV